MHIQAQSSFPIAHTLLQAGHTGAYSDQSNSFAIEINLSSLFNLLPIHMPEFILAIV